MIDTEIMIDLTHMNYVKLIFAIMLITAPLILNAESRSYQIVQCPIHSADATSELKENPARAVFDGKMSTSWIPADKKSQWIMVDFEEPESVLYIEIVFDLAHSSNTVSKRTIDVECSRGEKKTVSIKPNIKKIRIDLNSSLTQWIRVSVSQSAIAEIIVYKTESVYSL